MTSLFSERDRDDWSRALPNEEIYAFLDRSATPYYAEVRRLLESWLSHVPDPHKAGLIGQFRSGNRHNFESGFWELYLHEVYTRSGFDVEIHPDVPGSEKHPDFRVEGLGERFYIEAVRVGEPPLDVGQQRRLRDVEALLDSLRSEDYTIHFSWYAVGPTAPSTRQLRAEISAWLQALDPGDSNDSTTFQTIGPALEWIRDGWHLVFEAIRRPWAASSSTAAIGIRGPAEARVVDNAAGVLRVLDSKANR